MTADTSPRICAGGVIRRELAQKGVVVSGASVPARPGTLGCNFRPGPESEASSGVVAGNLYPWEIKCAAGRSTGDEMSGRSKQRLLAIQNPICCVRHYSRSRSDCGAVFSDPEKTTR